MLIQAIIDKPDDPKSATIIQEILSLPGVDPNLPEKRIVDGKEVIGRSPINWAVERGNKEAVRLLGKAGANLNVVDPISKKSPLAFIQSETNVALREAWHMDEIEKILFQYNAKTISH